MRSFKICLSVILMSCSAGAFAQEIIQNALLFSRTKPGGSARIQAMGGAQVALGGDYSSALSNPAGLGMYNRSEFTFSPALNFYNSDSEHLGTRMNDSKTVLNIPGVSYVRHLPMEKGGFLGGSFGVSLSRINDFQNTFQYGGSDNFTSIVDYFQEDAQGLDPEEFRDVRTQLGYDNYLIESESYDGGSDTDYFSFLNPDGPTDVRTLDRRGSVNIRGAQYQVSFAYGGNFSDKFYFGGSVGLTSIRYKYRAAYGESNFQFSLDPSYQPLSDLSMEETIDIRGSGLNLTLGMIYRPANFVQVGASFVTPTFYTLTDTYFARLNSQWNNFEYDPVTGDPKTLSSEGSELSSSIVSEYNLVTPLKFSTGVAFFIGKYGFITGDVEFTNYSKAKYNSEVTGISYQFENDIIKSAYKAVTNFRLGGEFRYDIFRLRGGYSIQNNPYHDVSYETTTISAGAGLKFKEFFIDAAWLRSKGASQFSAFAFQDGTGPVAALENTLTSFMITTGFNF